MEFEELISNYNRIYGAGEPFGDSPENTVRSILKYLKQGKFIELGAGSGRNALFLAANGFEVTAVDISQVGIDKLKQKAAARNLKVRTVIADVMGFRWDCDYDAVLFLFMLHHLKLSDAQRLLTEVRAHTTQGGLNVIAAFTKDGDFNRLYPEKCSSYFYPERGGVKSWYRDWDVLEWQEMATRAFEKTEKGEPMFNLTSFLIAQRPM